MQEFRDSCIDNAGIVNYGRYAVQRSPIALVMGRSIAFGAYLPRGKCAIHRDFLKGSSDKVSNGFSRLNSDSCF